MTDQPSVDQGGAVAHVPSPLPDDPQRLGHVVLRAGQLAQAMFRHLREQKGDGRAARLWLAAVTSVRDNAHPDAVRIADEIAGLPNPVPVQVPELVEVLRRLPVEWVGTVFDWLTDSVGYDAASRAWHLADVELKNEDAVDAALADLTDAQQRMAAAALDALDALDVLKTRHPDFDNRTASRLRRRVHDVADASDVIRLMHKEITGG